VTSDELRALADEWARLGIPDNELPIDLARLCAELGEALETIERLRTSTAPEGDCLSAATTLAQRALAKLAELKAP